MGTITKKYAFAALAASLFIFLLLGCEPESSSAAGGASIRTGITSSITPLSVTGFSTTATSDPNGEYSLITDLSSLRFSSDYADGGEASIDLSKPVYKLDVVSGGQTVTWYLWASLNPSRYVLSRTDVEDGWYFDDTSPVSETPNIGGSWKKVAADTSSQDLIADSTKATAETNAQVALLPKGAAVVYDETARKTSVSVIFRVPVAVDTSGGTPTFRLTLSKPGITTPGTKIATYVSGGGTDTLVFEYRRDDWGTIGYPKDPVALNGGTITYDTTTYPATVTGIAAQTNLASIPYDAVAIGIGSGAVGNDRLTASSHSVFSPRETYPALLGRLNNSSGWVAGTQNSSEYYWQVDMAVLRGVVRVATQGHPTRDNWIKTYKLQYSTDGTNWTNYPGNVTFNGNSDRSTVVSQELTLFRARYVRFVAQTWNGYAAGRFEVYESK